MSSIVDEVELEPAFESDNIRNGSFYFACLNVQRKTSPESYWIVLRPPREWLPTGFFDTRPVQERVFPFWILGRTQRIWLPRSSIFNLHRSQRHIFPTRKKRHEFDEFFDLIESFKTLDAALKHFEHEVLDATAQYNQRRQKIDESVTAVRRRRSSSLLMDETINDVRSAVEREQQDASGDVPPVEPQTKRRRLDETERPDQPVDRESSFPTSERSRALTLRPSSSSNNPKVKTEPEKRHQILMSTIKDDNRVRIYVGVMSEECSADVFVLQQSSPVLFSLICSSDAAEGKYIMHPRLRTIVTDDFLAVLEFMQTGEYSPALIDDSLGPANTRLDGLVTTEDHSDFLVQAGRLYLLAKMFQVRGMVELIIRKVTCAQSQCYSNIAVIELARIVLSRPVVEKKRLFNNHTNAVAFDPFDQWIVDRLAGNLMEIMHGEIEHNRYLVMVHATSKRQVHAEVLERAAALYRQIGGLPEVIDDD